MTCRRIRQPRRRCTTTASIFIDEATMLAWGDTYDEEHEARETVVVSLEIPHSALDPRALGWEGVTALGAHIACQIDAISNPVNV